MGERAAGPWAKELKWTHGQLKGRSAYFGALANLRSTVGAIPSRHLRGILVP